MAAAFIERMMRAVRKKTGNYIEEPDLWELLELYSEVSNKQLASSLKRKVKGERGGEDVETSAEIEDIEIVLAARRAWE